MPNALKQYNQKMGGVDLFDQFVATKSSNSIQKVAVAIFCMGFKCCHDKCLAIVQKSSQQKCSYALFYHRSCDDNADFLGTWKTTSTLVSQKYPGKPLQRQGQACNLKR